MYFFPLGPTVDKEAIRKLSEIDQMYNGGCILVSRLKGCQIKWTKEKKKFFEHVVYPGMITIEEGPPADRRQVAAHPESVEYTHIIFKKSALVIKSQSWELKLNLFQLV